MNILIVLAFLNLIALGWIIVLVTKSKKNDGESSILRVSLEESGIRTEKVLREEMQANRQEGAESQKRLREELAGSFKGFGDSLDRRMTDFAAAQTKNFETFSTKLSETSEKNDQRMEKVRETVEKKLEIIQRDNAEKLERMRQTVDEKLHATLEKRFGESFKLVSERLDLVHKGLGEMQTIAVGVGDLKKVLSNVKTRGTWGEAQLGNLISEILTPDQYDINVKTKKRSESVVEFAIKLPGSGEDIKHVWLPIDAKFPLEDYQKLMEAQERGDLEAIPLLAKALEQRIKSEAKDIKEKYLNPPDTTDFGILFVPIESLYAEVLRIPGLFEHIRQQYKVIITGPTTIQAILNSLQMGFRTLAIQKRSSEVWEVLGKVKTEFGNFGDLLAKTSKKLQEASNTIEDAAAKTRNIQIKLNKVQELPVTTEEQVAVTQPVDEIIEIPF